MLARHSEHMENALAELSPDDRALLELSLLRGVSDEEIAELLKVDTEHVQVRRDEALEQLIQRLDDAAQVSELREQKNGDASHRTKEIPAVADGEAPPAESNGAAKAPRRGLPDWPRWLVLLGLGLLAVIVLAVVMATSGGGGEEPQRGEPEAPPPVERKPVPTPAAEDPAPAPVALEPLGPAPGARGTAAITDGRLQLKASGLMRGAYTVWLYDSVIDAKQVARFNGTSADLEAKLPNGWERYRSIDVSREPADRNPNHSGESLLRAPVSKLSGR